MVRHRRSPRRAQVLLRGRLSRRCFHPRPDRQETDLETMPPQHQPCFGCAKWLSGRTFDRRAAASEFCHRSLQSFRGNTLPKVLVRYWVESAPLSVIVPKPSRVRMTDPPRGARGLAVKWLPS
jgi:hypothetical protein